MWDCGLYPGPGSRYTPWWRRRRSVLPRLAAEPVGEIVEVAGVDGVVGASGDGAVRAVLVRTLDERGLQQLEEHPLAERIVAVFPTLVFGGGVDGRSPFPTSYLTEGLKEGCNWLWLARWLRADASFHFIHAADIAKVCCHLALNPHQRNPEAGQGAVRRLVLGQPSVSVDQTVAALCGWRGVWRPPGLPLWPWLIQLLIKVLPIEINDWDRFSIRQRHFVHEPISPPERFGLTSHAPNLETVFEKAGLPRRGRV